MEARYETVLAATEKRATLDDHELAAQLIELDRRLFPEPAAYDKLDVADVDFAFRTASLVSFYSATEAPVRRMQRLLAVLEMHDRADRRHYSELHEGLVRIRDFEAARRLRRAHPDIADELPTLRDVVAGSGPTMIEMGPEGTLDRVEWRPLHPVEIVVVAHPSCTFSTNAIKAIEANREFGPMFLERALFLAPVDGTISESVFREWNVAHPQAPIRIAYSRNEWDMIRDWATPTFYFLRDGVVVETMSGWPTEGRWRELRAILLELQRIPSQ